MRDLEKLAQNLYISPAAPSQCAALACFEPYAAAILEARRFAFKARRDYLVPAPRELGFAVPVDFFVYADCSRFDHVSERFCRRALQGAGVTPGIDFGTWRAERHVRLAYTVEMARLEEGIARLGAILAAAVVKRIG